MIRFNCPKCQQALDLPDGFASLRVKCTRCGESVAVPNASGSAAPADGGSPAPSPPPLPLRRGRTIKIPCPFCREMVEYRPELAGTSIACKDCGQHAVMPAPTSLPEPYKSQYQKVIEKAKAAEEAEQAAVARAEEQRRQTLIAEQERNKAVQEWQKAAAAHADDEIRRKQLERAMSKPQTPEESYVEGHAAKMPISLSIFSVIFLIVGMLWFVISFCVALWAMDVFASGGRVGFVYIFACAVGAAMVGLLFLVASALIENLFRSLTRHSNELHKIRLLLRRLPQTNTNREVAA